ncbi:MAG: substrate-binding domain-containing protein [Phycisphaeraceae bacterium]
MNTGIEDIGPITSRQGEPLYETVGRAILQAIDQGVLQPGQRLPTTDELSRQLNVSLVTTHRALQGLVAEGVLKRVRGMGTFVRENHRELRPRILVGVLSHAEASMGDYYHGRVLDGMRQAAIEHRVDLVLTDYDLEQRNDLAGYILINPVKEELDRVVASTEGNSPLLVVGTMSHRADIAYIDTDNVKLAAQAVEHLYRLGHRRIGYVGGGSQLGDSRDRRQGFEKACELLQLPHRDRPVLDVPGYRLANDELLKLSRMISDHKLTAIFAGGYYLALDVYDTAATLGLTIPDDLSVVGVDDPTSAARLRPPMTTFRQPLIHMGHAAVASIRRAHDQPDIPIPSETLQAELIIRDSSGTPKP